jgi:hypothetical protein
MNAYEFIIKMKDMASSTLRNVAQSVGMTRRDVDGLNSSMRNAEQTSGSLGNTMGKLKNILAATFAVGAIWGFTNKVVDARAEYEKFNAVLANTFQSDKVGAAALNMLTDFATKTPFQLNDLTGSFVKLVNRGFNPTMAEMTKLGDLASSQGKGFDQLTEAVLDAQTGEFERLKEFGIKASKAGDKVTLSFKGVTKEVKNNDAAIRGALMAYGEMTGVAGSMSVISQTLGGKISNLGDQWNNFLVAVGGESGGIFSGVIDILASGLTFLQNSLPYISIFFKILWDSIQPVITALMKFLKVAFGFGDAASVMNGFGDTMTGLLVIVDIFTTGLSEMLNFLTPFTGIIWSIVGAWAIWNYSLVLFNALMAVNPITWLIIGIMSLILIIGMVAKYTSGWGESWTAIVNGAKLTWQYFIESIQAKWSGVTNTFMIGINKIKIAFIEFKEAMGMGDSAVNQKMIAQIKSDSELRKKAMIDDNLKAQATAQKAKEEFGKIHVRFDSKAFSSDVQSIKKKFSGLGQKDTGTGAYDDFVKKGQKGLGDKDKGKDKKSDNIVSGGNKMTSITINIEKLQDDTKIFVASTEQGLNSLGDKVQEMILRAVNSVNQMQTN